MKNISVKRQPPRLTPEKYSKNDILPKLENHRDTLGERISSVNFILFITKIEYDDWLQSIKVIEKKISSKRYTKEHVNALRNMLDTVTRKAEQYPEHIKKMEKALEVLETRNRKIISAISSVDIANNIQALNSSLNGTSLTPLLDFNIEEEDREIKSLLYSTEALLELRA